MEVSDILHTSKLYEKIRHWLHMHSTNVSGDADELERTGVKLAAQGPPEVDLHQIKEKPQFSSSSQSNRSENKSSSKRKGVVYQYLFRLGVSVLALLIS